MHGVKASPVPMALESGTVYEACVPASLRDCSPSQAPCTETTLGSEKKLAVSQRTCRVKGRGRQEKGSSAKPVPEAVEGPPVLRRASSTKPAEPPPSTPPRLYPGVTDAHAAPASAPAATPSVPNCSRGPRCRRSRSSTPEARCAVTGTAEEASPLQPRRPGRVRQRLPPQCSQTPAHSS